VYEKIRRRSSRTEVEVEANSPKEKVEDELGRCVVLILTMLDF